MGISLISLPPPGPPAPAKLSLAPSLHHLPRPGELELCPPEIIIISVLVSILKCHVLPMWDCRATLSLRCLLELMCWKSDVQKLKPFQVTDIPEPFETGSWRIFDKDCNGDCCCYCWIAETDCRTRTRIFCEVLLRVPWRFLSEVPWESLRPGPARLGHF